MQHLRLSYRTRLPLTAIAIVTAAAIGGGSALAQDQQASPPGGGDQPANVYSSAGCSGCHGAEGEGGIGPKLAGDQDLSDAAAVLKQIINGGGGMPAFGEELSDAEIAAVASHIRTSFGNNFGEVTEDEVAQAKAGGGGEEAAGAEEQQPSMEVGAVNLVKEEASSEGPSQDELTGAADATDNWLMYNKGYNNQRWSSLDQINADNAGTLAPVCIAQLGATGSFQGSPVIYDGLLYITTAHDTFALDAATCEVKWRQSYAPSGEEPFDTNRGVAIAGGRVFRGTPDAHLIALDAKTGELLWDTRLVDSANGYFLSSAPTVYNDTVYIGTAGADWGASAFLFAVNAATGETKWKFDQIDPETFGSAEAAASGGGSNWTHYAIDPERNLIYVPVGNPAPDFAPEYRPGDNLYTDSVIALNLETGELDHYYQQIPNDALDHDTAAAPMLFSGADGVPYVAVTNKAGRLYVYDDDAKEEKWVAETTTIENYEQDGRQTRPTIEGVRVCPGINGGVEWYGQAYDADANRIVTPAVDWCSTYTLGEVRYTPGEFFFGGSYQFDPVEDAQGRLRAFDAESGDMVWEYVSDFPLVAAVTPTAGGVIFTGELTGNFLALNKETGDVLYRFNTGGPVGGGVSTYEVEGRQYVAVASGNSSRTWTPDAPASSTLVIFALPEATQE